MPADPVAAGPPGAVSLSDRVAELTERAAGDLERARAFRRYTELVWTLFKIDHDGGHLARSWGTIADEKRALLAEVAGHAEPFLQNELPEATLLRAYFTFDAFLAALIRAWLADDPTRLRPRKGQDEPPTVSVDDVLGAADRDAVLRLMVDRRVRKLMHAPLRRALDFVARRMHVAALPADLRGRLAEIKATRDALVHAGGVAGEEYERGLTALALKGEAVEAASVPPRAARGERLQFPDAYITATLLALTLAVRKLGGGTVEALARASEGG